MPKVEVTDLHLVFSHPSVEWEKASLNGHDASISIEDDRAVVRVPVRAFNARSDHMEFTKGDTRFSFHDQLEKYRFDESQILSHAYMTENFLSSGARAIQGEDMLYKAMIYLDRADPQWQFWGGMITNACFRISEKFEATADVVDFLYERYMTLAPSLQLRADHSTRWFLSASLNLAIMLMFRDKVEQAQSVMDEFCKKEYRNGSFPLTYINLANLYFLRSALALYMDDREKAYLLAADAAEVCHDSVAKLFTSRNRYYFAHRYDVEAGIKLGYAASMVAVALGGPRHPTDAVMEYPIRRHAAINYDLVSWRYTPSMKRLPAAIYGINSKLNSISRGLR